MTLAFVIWVVASVLAAAVSYGVLAWRLRPVTPAVVPLPPPGDVITLHVVRDDLYRHAVDLVRQQRESDAAPDRKRHVCYALLIKVFPGRAKRDIALAIEAALREPEVQGVTE